MMPLDFAEAADKPSFADRLRAQLADAPALAEWSQGFIDKYDGDKKPRRRRTKDEMALASREGKP